MDKIKILSVEDAQTKMGRPFKKLEVEINGETRKVNVFSSAPNFVSFTAGYEFMAKMTKDGNYWNLEFENSAQRGNPNFKSQQIEKVMERKENSIGKFQDNRELSIKVSSTMRDAVSLAIAEFEKGTQEEMLQGLIIKWRTWLWVNWDIEPKDYPPFP